jgi:hypothetical protein
MLQLRQPMTLWSRRRQPERVSTEKARQVQVKQKATESGAQELV